MKLDTSTMRPALLLYPLLLAVTSAFEVTDFSQIEAAKKSPDKRIIINNLHVPAGTTLDLRNLQNGTVVEFHGLTTFGYAEWRGPMILIKGTNIRVEGKPGNLLDGEGRRWWDGKGGHGKTKPRFMEVILQDSVVTGLNIKNPPVWCFVANWCENVYISELNIDIADGDKQGGHNTDGIGVGYGHNVTVANCKVHNQDDCFVTGAGSQITVDNLECRGGHGISIGSLGRGAVVENVVVKNSKVINNMVGIRIKSTKNETGAIRNIVFDNIQLINCFKQGIIIQGNYPDPGPPGEPTPFPIENITINNVYGTVSRKGTNILVWVDPNSAKNWTWNSNVTGGKRELKCKGVPAGLNIPCGKK